MPAFFDTSILLALGDKNEQTIKLCHELIDHRAYSITTTETPLCELNCIRRCGQPDMAKTAATTLTGLSSFGIVTSVFESGLNRDYAYRAGEKIKRAMSKRGISLSLSAAFTIGEAASIGSLNAEKSGSNLLFSYHKEFIQLKKYQAVVTDILTSSHLASVVIAHPEDFVS